jgi:hypothetical protein
MTIDWNLVGSILVALFIWHSPNIVLSFALAFIAAYRATIDYFER